MHWTLQHPTYKQLPVATMIVAIVLAATVACGGSSQSTATPTASVEPNNAAAPSTSTAAIPSATIKPTMTARPKASPTMSRVAGLPERRQILLLSDLHDWQPYTEFGVSAGPERASYRVRIDEMLPETDQNLALFQTRRISTKYDDVEVSMNMRLHDASGYSESCLTVRSDTFDAESWSAYFLCISTAGDVWLSFNELTQDGEWRTDWLSDAIQATSIRDLGEWNTLTLVAEAQSFWFIVNDVLVGTAEHDGPTFGDVGMYTLAAGGPAEWEYTLLKVYELESFDPAS